MSTLVVVVVPERLYHHNEAVHQHFGEFRLKSAMLDASDAPVLNLLI